MTKRKFSGNPLLNTTQSESLATRLEKAFDENKMKQEQVKNDWAANKPKSTREAFKSIRNGGGEFDENDFE